MATPLEPRTISGEPGGISTLLRAALPAVPVVNRLPGVRKAPPRDFSGLAFFSCVPIRTTWPDT